MAVNETIVTGRKFRKCIDEINKKWQRYSFWGKAEDTEFDDGKNAEIKLGAIDGITDSLASTSSRIAASAKSVNQLSNDLTFPDGTKFYPDIKDGVRGYNTDAARGADTFRPFSSAELLWMNHTPNSAQDNITISFDSSKYNKLIILSNGAIYSNTDRTYRSISILDVDLTRRQVIALPFGCPGSPDDYSRKVTFTDNLITITKGTGGNAISYATVLKIWGINMEENFYAYP